MGVELVEIGQRIQSLRLEAKKSIEDMAFELEVSSETYEKWEQNGKDIPISALYHMAKYFDVEFNEIVTGSASRLNTYHIVKAGEGREVDRYPGYYYEDLAWRYSGKIMQPLLVVLDPTDEPAKLVSHPGQEFNYVIEGTVIITWCDKEFELHAGDSMYFNPALPHSQRCGGDTTAKFVTVIAE